MLILLRCPTQVKSPERRKLRYCPPRISLPLAFAEGRWDQMLSLGRKWRQRQSSLPQRNKFVKIFYTAPSAHLVTKDQNESFLLLVAETGNREQHEIHAMVWTIVQIMTSETDVAPWCYKWDGYGMGWKFLGPNMIKGCSKIKTASEGEGQWMDMAIRLPAS